MLRFFQPISRDDAAQQQQHALHQSAAAAAAEAARRTHQQLHRAKPGRPRKLSLTLPSAACDEEEGAAPHKRGKFVNWFASPYIHDILVAYRLCSRSAKKTVAHLQHTFPRLPTESAARFADLSESTLRSWHDQDGALLPRFKQILDEQGAAATRGPGRSRVLLPHPEIEAEVKRVLTIMRERGAVVNVLVIRLVMRAIMGQRQPALLQELKLSSGFVSTWAREQLSWTWRVRTTAASKVPLDWREQGVLMAKRIAFNIQAYKVHPSLVINMDQTGVHLAPVDSRTYETKGCKEVKVIGAEDKRQITACIGSSLNGDMLPLQLIFQGKTAACHPPATEASVEAHVHLTHSDNHWSNQTTMQEYVREVIVPYAERCAAEHTLPRDSHIVLVLDVWAVHKSEEFRRFLRTHHPNIHLVFVPPNCTSQLQVADVVLQRPFKAGLRNRFNEWAAGIITEQIEKHELCGLAPYLKMSMIKPLILQWCIAAWTKMKLGRDYIKMGWHSCCGSLFNVHDVVKRLQVVEEVALGILDKSFIPEDADPEEQAAESEEEDEEKDELDVMKERQYGSRKSTRKRAQPSVSGYMLNSSLIHLTEDSDS
jgi:hypothetical protein